MESDDYKLDDEGVADEEDDVEEEANEPEQIQDDMEVTKSEETDDIDPSLADWFKVEDEKDSGGAAKDTSDTESDNDSDNEDMKLNPEEELDEWFKAKPEPDSAPVDLKVRPTFVNRLRSVVVDK